jgi:outer membrane protein OmpA-like peptidoglycan-associated protein
MQNSRYLPIFLLAGSVLAGCSSMPKENLLLSEARNEYSAAQNNPDVVQLAQPALTDAGISLDKANTAFAAKRSEDEVNKLAYLARQKIATTQEIAKRKAAEKTVANADKERNQLRLDQRSAQVDRARNDATIAQNQAERAEARTANAEQMTAEAEARNRQLEAMLTDLSAKKTERGMTITLGDVLFNVDRAELKPDGVRNLRKLADFMKQYPERTVLIEGYTDSTGSSAHNMELSKRRAQAVSTELESLGVEHRRNAIHSYGEEYPVAGNDSAENRQLNRRVEIVLSDENGHVIAR